MYRIIVGFIVFAAFVFLGGGSYVEAQTTITTCPDISGTWLFVQHKITLWDNSSKAPTSSSGSFTISQNTGEDNFGIVNNCLFTAEKVVKTASDTIPPFSGNIARYTGVIVGSKITMQALPKRYIDIYGSNDTGGYIIPPVTFTGEFTKFSRRRPKVPIEIQYTGNDHVGEAYTEEVHIGYPGNPPYPGNPFVLRVAESVYGTMIPYTTQP